MLFLTTGMGLAGSRSFSTSTQGEYTSTELQVLGDIYFLHSAPVIFLALNKAFPLTSRCKGNHWTQKK